MICRAFFTCAAFDSASFSGADPNQIFKPNAHIPSHSGSHRGDRHLIAARSQHRPVIIRPSEQPVSSAAHVHDIFRMRSDTPENAKHRLHEEWRFYDTAFGKMRERVEMTNVVAFDFETRAVLGAGTQDIFDIGEGVAKNAFARESPSR